MNTCLVYLAQFLTTEVVFKSQLVKLKCAQTGFWHTRKMIACMIKLFSKAHIHVFSTGFQKV